MKKILITGGAGFLGSNLCEKLLKEQPDSQVICLDNFFTGRRDNVKKLLQNKRFRIIEHDVVEPFPVDLVVDEIYNLACPASPLHYQKDPVYTTKINVLGILHALELAKRCKAKILQASTSEVYGEPEVHPQVESYRGNVNCTGIRSCYDEGKRCAESLVFDYNRMYGVRTKVIRIFNTYGPNMAPEDGRVVSNFIMQSLRNENITIYGKGKQTRSLCYVDDLLNGMVCMMGSDDTFIGPVNLGNPEEHTVFEIAQKIRVITGTKAKIVYCELPKDDPTQRCPDNSMAKFKLGWQPRVNVEDGLKKTVEYFRGFI
jgi:UDP-glucuronate decarboxylase